MKELLEEAKLLYKELANNYNVTISTIQSIKSNKTWQQKDFIKKNQENGI